jgi:hypothetical protein
MAQFTNPDELKQIIARVAHERAQAKMEHFDPADEERRRAFRTRQIEEEEVPDRINKVIHDAAERGELEALVLRFPASYCNDGGRRINNFDPDWPASLEGFGKTAFDYYAKELRPLGYTMRAEILNFPGGMMGDVGLYLRWADRNDA